MQIHMRSSVGVLGCAVGRRLSSAQAPRGARRRLRAGARLAGARPPPASRPAPLTRSANGAYQIGPPASLPPAGSGPGRLPHRASASRSRATCRSSSPRPTSTTSSSRPQPAVAERLDALQRRRPSRRSSTTSSACGPRTSSTTSRSKRSTTRSRTASIGKVVIYNMEERQRVKITIYNEGTKEIEQSKIDEKLRELGITIRLDTFIDPGHREARGERRPRHADGEGLSGRQGRARASRRCPAGRSSVHLTFKMTEGPKVKISNVDFVGNKVVQRRQAEAADEEEQGRRLLDLPGQRHLPGRQVRRRRARASSTFYRDHGYLAGRTSAQPKLKPLSDSTDGKTRCMSCEIPVDRRRRATRSASSTSTATTRCRATSLRPLFKLKPGEYYNEKRVREGLREDARDLRRGRLLRVHRLPD